MSNDLANENALFGRHHFLVRRLHSLSGIVPIGVFLCVHLLTNASVLAPGDPGAEFQKAVEKIHALGPMLIPVEIVEAKYRFFLCGGLELTKGRRIVVVM